MCKAAEQKVAEVILKSKVEVKWKWPSLQIKVVWEKQIEKYRFF